MPKSVLFSWVKNANNLLTRRGVGGVLLSSVYKKSVRVFMVLVGKVVVTPKTIHLKTTYFSTKQYWFLYLLNDFYTPNPQALLLRSLYRN